MCTPKRNYTDGLISSHGCDEKNDLSVIINCHVFVPSLSSGRGIASNKRGLADRQQKPCKEMHGTLQRVAMFLSIDIVFVLVVIDLGASDHQPKVIRTPRRQAHG
jgi:hypothetical protein